MNRQTFLRQLGLVAGGVSFGLDGLAGRAFGHNPFLRDLAGTDGRVLVLVQLQGGNDGTNTIVPIEDATYYTKRPTVSIKKAEALPLQHSLLGLHPSLAGLQQLYEQGLASVVMNVGYANQNRSHFRSTDIWMTASEPNELLQDGWLARYLTTQYPDFPVSLPTHPMAVQLGSVCLLYTSPSPRD